MPKSRVESQPDADEVFLSAVSIAVQNHTHKLAAALELATVSSSATRTPPSIADFLSTAEYLTDKQRAAFIEHVREFGEGAKTVGKSARRKKGEGSGESSFSLEFNDPEVAELFTRYLMSVVHIVLRPETADESRKASLMLMTASLEALVADVSRALVTYRPEVVALGSREISLQTLETLGSATNVKKYLVERTVESLMWGGIEDWVKWFEGYSIKWRDIPTEWWPFREISARRNLVAHADSKYNAIYLQLSRENGGSEPPAEGTHVTIDSDYLRDAHDYLAAFGVLLAASARMQWQHGDLKRAYAWATQQAEELLEAGSDLAAREIGTKLLEKSHGRLERSIDNRLRVIVWSARKSREGVTSIEREVKEHDFTSLDLRVAHMKHVLLNEDEDAIRCLRVLLERNEITRTRILHSSAYADLRGRSGTDWILDGT